MEIKRNTNSKKAVRIMSIVLPAVALAAISFFPLRPQALQILVGIALIWFQTSLMLGIWS